MDLERLGPYNIVGKIGRGGMGTVFEGVHRDTGEPAAVKLLSAALAEDDAFRSRFEAEIEALRKLNHPNIVRLFGFGRQEDLLFYSMELVDGNSLEEELARGRRFDWREATRIAIETCRALRHAHDRGVIHRDIKPGNVLLAADGRVKLSDFGIARLFGQTHLTSAGGVLGTAEYMAPEQADGRPVDARADLYSLGALLYALVARRTVFRGKSLPEVLHKQRFEAPDPLRKHAADVPEEFERIVGQLLEKDPERRIPNAGVLGRRFEALLHAMSVSPETIEADPAWFDSDEPSEAVVVDPPDSTPAAPRSLSADGFDGGPPATQASQRAASDPLADEATVALADVTSAKPAPPPKLPGHFVPVSEEELDRPEPSDDEPTWRAIISWQTWALIAALLLVGTAVWWSLQPATADSLYQRIDVRMNADSPDERPRSGSEIAEVEALLGDFLRRFPKDPRAAGLQGYEKDLQLLRMEWEFNSLLKGRPGKTDLLPVQYAYVDAIAQVRVDPSLALAKLEALVVLYDQPGENNEPTRQCLALARQRIEPLRKDIEQRAVGQRAIIEARLDVADALRHDAPDRARAMYRAVIALYGDKPWAADSVRRAQRALVQEPKGTSEG